MLSQQVSSNHAAARRVMHARVVKPRSDKPMQSQSEIISGEERPAPAIGDFDTPHSTPRAFSAPSDLGEFPQGIPSESSPIPYTNPRPEQSVAVKIVEFKWAFMIDVPFGRTTCSYDVSCPYGR